MSPDCSSIQKPAATKANPEIARTAESHGFLTRVSRRLDALSNLLIVCRENPKRSRTLATTKSRPKNATVFSSDLTAAFAQATEDPQRVARQLDLYLVDHKRAAGVVEAESSAREARSGH